MTFPTAIAFRGVRSSEILRAEVLQRVKLLDKLSKDILACRVLIEGRTQGLRSRCHYVVYLRLAMPCIEIEAGSPTSELHEHIDLAISDSFEQLTSRVENFVRRRCVGCERQRPAQPP